MQAVYDVLTTLHEGARQQRRTTIITGGCNAQVDRRTGRADDTNNDDPDEDDADNKNDHDYSTRTLETSVWECATREACGSPSTNTMDKETLKNARLQARRCQLYTDTDR